MLRLCRTTFLETSRNCLSASQESGERLSMQTPGEVTGGIIITGHF